MKKIQRIMAWIGIVVLAGLYLSTIVFALIGTETSLKLLKASVLCTIGFPFVLYGYQLMYRVLKGRGADEGVPPDEPTSNNNND